MVKEIYRIVVSKIDDDLGIECGDQTYHDVYKEYPSPEDILVAIKSLQGDVARVEKRYVIDKN